MQYDYTEQQQEQQLDNEQLDIENEKLTDTSGMLA
jgi:hypothetical protein